MTAQKKKRKHDIEKNYAMEHFVKKLRRLADCIEQSQKFQIRVTEERICISSITIINFEHEHGASLEAVEFPLTWLLDTSIRHTG